MTDLTSKPITLHARTDVNARVDVNAKAAAFTCAHPDGLLGAYEVVIPWWLLKRVAAAMLQWEAGQEVREKQASQQRRIASQ